MSLDASRFAAVTAQLAELRLLKPAEIAEVMSIFEPTYPFAAALALADSVHLHIKVDAVAALPHARIRALGTEPVNARDGYVKYPFAGGINAIFSSIPIAQDDLLVDALTLQKPALDHMGIDLRQENPTVQAAFDAVPALSKQHGWRHVQQGGPGQPVYCCHVEVGVKHWAYPSGAGAQRRPVEFAYGAIKINAGSMGCDLRPVDPSHPQAAALQACAVEAKPAAGAPPSYYDPRELGRFAELGRLAGVQMDRFLGYLESATETPGGLSRREKALMALAVAHARHCPYSIDHFTSTSLEAGASPTQLIEAVHVAASVDALSDLAHGLQLQASLRQKGLLPK